MKQMIFFILGVFFLILGAIGLALPVIPQIPFLLLGVVFLSMASKRFKNKLISSEIYKKHLEQHVAKHKFISKFFQNGKETDEMSDIRKLLIVIDMQNDFIDGALGTKEAEAIVGPVVEKIRSYPSEDVFATMDTHGENYLSTQEGKNLPVEHCIKGTDGWNIRKEIAELLNKERIYEKPVFGSLDLAKTLKDLSEKENIELELVGLCTDICVVSNALLFKAFMPEVRISVDSGCCAGVTPESHEAALNTMRACQIAVE